MSNPTELASAHIYDKTHASTIFPYLNGREKTPSGTSLLAPTARSRPAVPPPSTKTGSRSVTTSKHSQRQKSVIKSTFMSRKPPSSPAIVLCHPLTDAHSSRWPTNNIESSVPNRPGIFRIDNVVANTANCASHESSRRRRVVRNVLVKLGTGVYDARMMNESAVEGVRSVSTSSKKIMKKQRQSHRQIPKQQEPEKQHRVLQALPQGYAIFQTRRAGPASGIEAAKAAKSFDTYIIGSESGCLVRLGGLVHPSSGVDRSGNAERMSLYVQAMHE